MDESPHVFGLGESPQHDQALVDDGRVDGQMRSEARHRGVRQDDLTAIRQPAQPRTAVHLEPEQTLRRGGDLADVDGAANDDPFSAWPGPRPSARSSRGLPRAPERR